MYKIIAKAYKKYARIHIQTDSWKTSNSHAMEFIVTCTSQHVTINLLIVTKAEKAPLCARVFSFYTKAVNYFKLHISLSKEVNWNELFIYMVAVLNIVHKGRSLPIETVHSNCEQHSGISVDFVQNFKMNVTRKTQLHKTLLSTVYIELSI